MLKKGISLAVSLFALVSLNACGTSDDFTALEQSLVTNTDQSVNANSLSGVWKEITKSSEAAFKSFDKNNDKFITPDEYGVSTAEAFTTFRKLDSNKDGKVSKGEYVPNFFEKTTLTLRLKDAADDLFKLLDKNKDKYITLEELNSGLVSTEFSNLFQKFDKQGKNLFGKSNKGKLTKSEFENLYAGIAMSAPSAAPAPADPVAPAPAPADPVAPAPATK